MTRRSITYRHHMFIFYIDRTAHVSTDSVEWRLIKHLVGSALAESSKWKFPNYNWTLYMLKKARPDVYPGHDSDDAGSERNLCAIVSPCLAALVTSASSS